MRGNLLERSSPGKVTGIVAITPYSAALFLFEIFSVGVVISLSLASLSPSPNELCIQVQLFAQRYSWIRTITASFKAFQNGHLHSASRY